MQITDEDAIHLALLPDPDAALAFLGELATGARLALAARKAGQTESAIKAWRTASTAFDRMCIDAEAIGTAELEDIGLTHVRAGTPGWSSVWKSAMQARSSDYVDKAKTEAKETVTVNVQKFFPDE